MLTISLKNRATLRVKTEEMASEDPSNDLLTRPRKRNLGDAIV